MGNITLCPTTRLHDRIINTRERLYRIAVVWCGDQMLADDLVQETIVSAMKNHRQLRDKNCLFGWVCSIMKNHWYQHLRKQRKHDNIDDQLNLPSYDHGPFGKCQEMDIIRQVRIAVNDLTLQQRQVIALVDLSELTYCDVAQALDIPVGTVMSRLHKARKTLLKKLEINQRKMPLDAPPQCAKQA
ncbi:MAG TPA: RNA polymerase sigma factor [Gammaproteobacteria bacterium]|nr:RNA polymerase sigma factor [Gammaproteobacteria bacterium]